MLSTQEIVNTDSNLNLTLFIEAMEQYVVRQKSLETQSEVVHSALEVFNKIPTVFCVSLFLLNEEEFEFKHRSTIPESQKEDAVKQFDKLIEVGYLGRALQSGKVMVSPDDYYQEVFSNRNSHHTLPNKETGEIENIIVPLVVSWGIIGIIVVTGASFSSGVSNILLKLCAIQGNLLASNLEKLQVYKTLEVTKKELEQKVASRTMDLAQNKRELRAILDSIHVGILVVDDSSDLIVKLNPNSRKIIGEPESIILKNKCSVYLPPALKSQIDTEKSFESKLISVRGEEIPVLRSVSTIRLTNGKFRIESFLDISDRKKAELALKEINEVLELKVFERTKDLELLVDQLKVEIKERELAEKEARRMLNKEKELRLMKSQFVSMVSHEFRTPLTMIKSASQIIEIYTGSLTKNEERDYLKRIITTVDYMTDLIDNVIFIGKNESELPEKNLSEVNLRTLCQDIISDLILASNGTRIITTYFEGEFTAYKSDVKLLKLILNNLLNNAIKYSPANTEVEFFLSSVIDSYQIEIKDYGIGIPDEDQDKIYDLFHRAYNVGNVSGTGLGMAVVLQSLKVLNGTIEFTSKENEGTTFHITLPKEYLR